MSGASDKPQTIPLLAMFGPEPTYGQVMTAISSAQRGGWLCNCIGPQRGEPVCPCRMKGVRIKGGRYVEEIDHGPAQAARMTAADIGLEE